MAVLLAATYHGPPQLTPLRAFTSWTLDLPVLLVVALAGGLYLWGMRRTRGAGERWPAGRIAAFTAGLGMVVIATMSFVGVYQHVLFYIRGVQTILLLLVAPLFLALGRPLTLVLGSLPAAGRLDRVIHGQAARVLTFPAITTAVLVVVPFVLYFSPWYEAGLRNASIRELTYLALVMPGLVFFWTFLRMDPVPKAYPYVVTLWVSAAEVVGDAILGLAIIADNHLIAGGYYLSLGRPWGPGPRTDQVLGGGAVWVLGDLVGLPFLAAQLIQMIREDEAEAVEIDAELDARDAALGAKDGAPGVSSQTSAAGTADAPDPAATADPAGAPWWEGDPRFADRFRSARPDQ
ncbi:MAG TPA: cytochrome c oxidase assembly protein [Streptosporangiaceae bacterium]|jgi:cytochrome c oxidase assembly factor CtaG|nr:cytochrome c oxidase assembly protein [Streptosporangiaceae bacterium]